MNGLYESKFDVTKILTKVGDSDIYYGIEIELEFSNESIRSEFISKFYSAFTNFVLKKEMTILCGLEIVSAPMTIEILEDYVPKLVLFCKDNFANTSERTGLHIHRTKCVHDIQIFRTLNNPLIREEVISFSGRLSEYARYTLRQYPANKSRGYCVNLQPPKTIEFRLFSLKLDSEWILGCLYFCDVISKNVTKLTSYDDIIAFSSEYPSFFTERLKNVTRTPKGKVYPIIYPDTNSQYW